MNLSDSRIETMIDKTFTAVTAGDPTPTKWSKVLTEGSTKCQELGWTDEEQFSDALMAILHKKEVTISEDNSLLQLYHDTAGTRESTSQ